MNVTELLFRHQAQLAAFANVLFDAPLPRSSTSGEDDDRKEQDAARARSGKQGRLTSSSLLLPHYRRPASANIPVSQVKREARRREGRRCIRVDKSARPGHLIDVVSNAAEMRADHRRRRRVKARRWCLTYTQWRGLLKRNVRLRARRRTGALRRRRRRQQALRYGKLCQPCPCSIQHSTRCVRSKRAAHTAAGDRCGHSRHVVQWLPSHRYAYSRFHMARHGVRLSYGTVHEPSAVVPDQAIISAAEEKQLFSTPNACRSCLLLPTNAKRGCHRCLQRWSTQLMYLLRHVDQPQGQPRRRRVWSKEGTAQQQNMPQAAPSLRQPPLSLLADLSYHCIYAVQPTCGSAVIGDEVTPASMSVFLRHVARLLGIVPDDATGVCDGQGWSVRTDTKSVVDATSGAVWLVYGHAWADVPAAMAHRRGVTRTTTTTARVVPVTLLALQTSAAETTKTLFSNDAHATTANVHCYLLSPRPVRFCRRALRACVVRLVSHWSPCTTVPQAAALFEWWCAAGSAAVPGVCYRAFRHAVSMQASRSAALRWRLPGDAHARVVLLPCLPTHPMTQRAHKSRLAHCAWQMLFLMHTPTEMTTPQLTNRALRRAHFHFARRFYGALLRYCRGEEDLRVSQNTTMTSPSAMPLLRAPVGFRAGVRSLATRERAELLHLLGRPAFPFDYGEPTRRVACVGNRQASADVQAMTRVVCCYGNLTNATRRLIVRAVHPGHGLPSAHAMPGAWLLAVKLGEAVAEHDGFCVLTRIGVVTSSPFFVQRMGCVVAPVWCCFADCAAEDWTALLPGEGQGATCATPPTRRWCLCPAGHAQKLLSRLAATSASERSVNGAEEKKTGPKSRRTCGAGQHYWRHDHARERDLVDELLCCRDYSTLVMPIDLYV